MIFADFFQQDARKNLSAKIATLRTDTGTPGCNNSNNGTDCGFNAATATSELAHMYFNNLGLDALLSTSGNFQSTYGIFGNGSGGQNDVGLVDHLQSF